MRIRSFHIDGFGIHRDFRLDELSPGLTVFYGPNEAGKTTLLAFLRGVLFGYPDGRSNEPKYVPVGGGAHGGRVTLSGPEGEVVVERFAGRGGKLEVTLENGRPGDAVDLAERLGHADARLFRSVFAFGLAELAELGSLGDAGIQDQLFSAGVTGAGRSARQALRDLHEESRERFAGQRTRKQDRVKEIVREIVDVRAELFLRQEAAERYPDLRDVEQALAAKLDALGADTRCEREEELRARKLVELWNEVWSPLAAAREQAAKLAPSVPESLPIDAATCLESSLTWIQADQDRLESLRAERVAVAAELEELPLDEAARAVAVRVAALHERLALHRAQCERQGELQELRDEC